MHPTVLIDAVDRTTQTRAPDSVRIEYALGARTRAEFEVRDYDSFATAYRAALDEGVAIVDGATPLFTGAIDNVTDQPLGAPGVGTVTKGQATCDWRYAARRRVVKTYLHPVSGELALPPWHLRGVVHDLVTTYLAVFGISLDPLMEEGPAFDTDLTFDYNTLEDAFQRLAALTGWVYRLTPSNVLEWFAIGDRLRPVTFSAANGNILGPLDWSRSALTRLNRVFVRYGSGLVTKTEAFVGDGVTTVWYLAYPCTAPGYLRYPDIAVGGELKTQTWIAAGGAAPAGYERYRTRYPASLDGAGGWPSAWSVHQAGVDVSGPVHWGLISVYPWYWYALSHTLMHNQAYPLEGAPPLSGGIIPAGATIGPVSYWALDKEGVSRYPDAAAAGWAWLFDPEGNLIVAPNSPEGPPAIPPEDGLAFLFEYSVQFPLIVMEEDADDIALRGPSEDLFEAPEIFDKAEAQGHAISLLRKAGATPRTVAFDTAVPLVFLPGDTVMLDVPARTLPSAPWLVTEVTVRYEGTTLLRRLTLLEGTEAQGSWIDFWRQALGSGSGSSVGIASGSVIPPPLDPVDPPPPPGTTAGAPIDPVFLGGSRNTSIAVTPAAWTPAIDWVPFTARAAFTARLDVDVWARTVGISVRARLFDVTAAAPVAGCETAPVTAIVSTPATALGTLIVGHRYRLELLSSASGEGVYGIGSLEAT